MLTRIALGFVTALALGGWIHGAQVTGPAAPVITAPSGTITTATPQIVGTGESGDTLVVSIDGVAVGSTTVGSGSWAYQVVAPGLSNASHTATAKQTNLSTGLISPVSNSQTFTVNVSPPAAPVITGPSGTQTTATVAVVGTGLVGATVNVKVDGVAAGTTTVQSDSSWRFTTAALSNASHNATATQTNAIGTSVVSNTQSWTTNVSTFFIDSAPCHGKSGSGGVAGTANTVTCTLTTVATNEVLIAATESNLAQTSGVGGAGLTWTLLCRQPSAANYISVWYAIAPSTIAAQTITGTQTGAGYAAMDVYGVVGANTTTPFDGTCVSANAGGITYSPSSSNTVALAEVRGSPSVQTLDAGFTAISNLDYLVSESRFITQPPSTSANVGSQSGNNGVIAFGVQAAGAAPPAPPAPVITGPSGTLTTASATVTGTGQTGATVTVLVDGSGTNGCTTTVAAGAWSCPTGALTNASHSATATQANVGGTSPVSNTQSWTTNVTGSTIVGYNNPAYTCVTNVYIETPANGGSDSNDGQAITVGGGHGPIATLAHFNAMNPTGGWCAQVGSGTFAGFSGTHSGTGDTATGYIAVVARNGVQTAFITPATASFYNTIDLSGGTGTHDYWVVDSLDILGPPNDVGGGGNGIEFEHGHHIKIMNNTVHGAWGACIAVYVTDYWFIYHNITYNCAWGNASAMSCLDTGGQIAFDTAAGFHGVTSRNIADGCAEGPAVTSANQHTDGNCFIADTYGAYAQQSLVENNVMIHCGARGLHILASSNVTVLNNTVLLNQTDLRWEQSNDGELTNIGSGSPSSNNTYCNNLVIEDGAYNPNNFAISDFSFNSASINSNVQYFNNLTYNGTAGQTSVHVGANTNSSITGNLQNGVNGNKFGFDPLIVAATPDLGFANFHVQSGSPALNAGTTTCGYDSQDFYGNSRIQGGQIDIGAAEGVGVPGWAQGGASDDMRFNEGLWTGGGYGVGSNGLLTNTGNTGNATDLLPTSPAGYAYLQYGAGRIRIAYNAPYAGHGLLDEPAATNYLINSALPATQTTGPLSAGTYTLWGNMEASTTPFVTAGSLVLSNGTATGCTGTATQGVPVAFTITAGTCTVTKNGNVYFEQLEGGNTGTQLSNPGTSGIVTGSTIASRGADFYKLAGSALAHAIGTPGSVFFSGYGSGQGAAFTPRYLMNDVNAAFVRENSTTVVYNYDSSATPIQLTATLGGSGNTTTGGINVALGWDGTGRSLVADGGTVATDSHTEPTTMTAIAVADTLPSGGNPYQGLIAEVAVWNSRLSDATLQGLNQVTPTGGGGGGVAPPPPPPPSGSGFDFNFSTQAFDSIPNGTVFRTTNPVTLVSGQSPQVYAVNTINASAACASALAANGTGCIVSHWNNDNSSPANPMWYIVTNPAPGTDGNGHTHSHNVLKSFLPQGDCQQQVNVAGYGYMNQITFNLASADIINVAADVYLDTNYDLTTSAKQVIHLGYGDATKTTSSSTNSWYRATPQSGGSNPVLVGYYAASAGTPAQTGYAGCCITQNTWHSYKLTQGRGSNAITRVIIDGVTVLNGLQSDQSTTAPPFLLWSTWFCNAPWSAKTNSIAYWDNMRVWSGSGP